MRRSWEVAARNALGAWVRDLAAKHRLEARVDVHPTCDAIRVTIWTNRGGRLRANFIDIATATVDACDTAAICTNVEECVVSLLAQLNPPKDGGAFTQDDAIKMFGGGRGKGRVRRSRS